ncbi:MAG: helix-turn-helix transcriptional regulator [Candidatus Limnocylindrales bacterium]
MDDERHPGGASRQDQEHGWSPPGRRRRWLEPFLLVLLADGVAHGYALIGRLNDLGVAPGRVDAGALYRTLRDLELGGLVASRWSTPSSGAPRREYVLTGAGRSRLVEWADVMHDRARLVDEFFAAYDRSIGGTVPAGSSDAEP